MKKINIGGEVATVDAHLGFIIKRLDKGDQVLGTTLLRELKEQLKREDDEVRSKVQEKE